MMRAGGFLEINVEPVEDDRAPLQGICASVAVGGIFWFLVYLLGGAL